VFLAGCHGFVRTKGIIPWIIRKLTKGDKNHTFVFITDTIIMESTLFRGVHYNHINQYLGKPVVITKPGWGDLDVEKHDQVARDMLFQVYGVLEAIGFLWVLLFNRQHNPITDGTVCSEWNWIHATRVWRDANLGKVIFKNNCNPNNLLRHQKVEWAVFLDTDCLTTAHLTVIRATDKPYE